MGDCSIWDCCLGPRHYRGCRTQEVGTIRNEACLTSDGPAYNLEEDCLPGIAQHPLRTGGESGRGPGSAILQPRCEGGGGEKLAMAGEGSREGLALETFKGCGDRGDGAVGPRRAC